MKVLKCRKCGRPSLHTAEVIAFEHSDCNAAALSEALAALAYIMERIPEPVYFDTMKMPEPLYFCEWCGSEHQTAAVEHRWNCPFAAARRALGL